MLFLPRIQNLNRNWLLKWARNNILTIKIKQKKKWLEILKVSSFANTLWMSSMREQLNTSHQVLILRVSFIVLSMKSKMRTMINPINYRNIMLLRITWKEILSSLITIQDGLIFVMMSLDYYHKHSHTFLIN